MITYKRRFNTFYLILCALFIALITVGAYIRIPVSLIPITLQLLFVMLAGQILPPAVAGLTVFVYICLGLLGLPVFSSGGGLGYVLTPSFGYLIGFFVAAIVISIVCHKQNNPPFMLLLLANFLGFISVYICGVVYYFLLNIFYFNSYVDFGAFLLTGFLIFLPSDLAFCFITAVIGRRIRPVLAKFKR